MSWPVVRVHVRPCGERLPLLVDRESGVPLCSPAIYVLTALRSRAANTIAQHLVGVQILLLWCHAEGVLLDERIASGALFRGHELDALWDAAARPVSHFSRGGAAGAISSRKVVKLDREVPALARDTVGNRRRALRRYLAWLTERRLFALGHRPDAQQTFRIARDELLRALDARSSRQGRAENERQGLEDAERRALLAAIQPASDGNPWKNEAVRLRNLLMITLLLQLGLRRGELLALRVEDVNLREGQIRLLRRPDNRKDSRRRQPVVKTQGRLLDIRSEAVEMISHYILQVRVHAPRRARSHGFLFVDQRTGAEISASSVEKIFRQLRAAPDVPSKLTCHVLRHDWNERFSKVMDEAGVAPERERQMRRYLQGWSSDESAAVYTRRHTRNKANEMSIRMQDRLAPARSTGDE